MASLTACVQIFLWWCTAATPTALSIDADKVEPSNAVRWTNVQLTRLGTKIALADSNRTLDDISSLKLFNDSVACGQDESCPCQKENECSADAICTNDISETLGYRCECKNGFIDIFYTEPPKLGRLCVKTVPLKAREETEVASSRFLSSTGVVDRKKPHSSNGDLFPAPPAFPAEFGHSLSQAQLRQVFDDLDQDKDGSISLRELKAYVHRLEQDGAVVKLGDADMRRMIQLADRNGDGVVDWNEFVRLFLQQKFFRLWAKKRVYS